MPDNPLFVRTNKWRGGHSRSAGMCAGACSVVWLIALGGSGHFHSSKNNHDHRQINNDLYSAGSHDDREGHRGVHGGALNDSMAKNVVEQYM